MTRWRRAASAAPSDLATDVALVGLLFAMKVTVDACVLRAGFSHVSDDDYARTVIAEQFAYAPRLDPSATSWLPLPFWITGAAMRLVGRSLGAARLIAVALGAVAVAAPYAAMRSARVSRAAALAATLVAMALPWSAWLGVATVPDGWTAALVAAGAVAMGQGAARPWCAAAFFCASLSRYEAWPACAMLAGLSAAKVTRTREAPGARRDVACALVALAGPALWMVWNAHAHGSPFHFMARVSAFRRAIGAADIPVADKVFGYPRALVTDTPEAAALWACGLVGLIVSPTLRSRWGWAGAVALAVLVFLVAGDLGDGAPTHHPARALGALVWIGVGMGIDALAIAVASRPTPAMRFAAGAAMALAAVPWVGSLPGRWAAAPGESDSERRDVQIARGLELRRLGVVGAEITPCQFEHFALIAAWGAPERVRIDARTGAAVSNDCPTVVTR